MKFAQQIRLPCLTRIVEKFGHVHLSAGDLLRAERASPGSQVGKKNSQLVFVTCNMHRININFDLKLVLVVWRADRAPHYKWDDRACCDHLQV